MSDAEIDTVPRSTQNHQILAEFFQEMADRNQEVIRTNIQSGEEESTSSPTPPLLP
jgi:hypothetical protein